MTIAQFLDGVRSSSVKMSHGTWILSPTKSRCGSGSLRSEPNAAVPNPDAAGGLLPNTNQSTPSDAVETCEAGLNADFTLRSLLIAIGTVAWGTWLSR